MDYQDSLDLLALELEQQHGSNEVGSCLVQLRWLATNDALERAVQLTKCELINQRHTLARSSFHEKAMIIKSVSSQGMRLGDGSLTSGFIAWYEEFCTCDEQTSVRRCSPQAIERGDHPCWEYINNQTHVPPERAGGKPGRRIAYLVAMSAIIDYLIKQPHRYNDDELWEKFVNFSPDYAGYNGVNYSGTPVDFEIQENSSGESYINAHYRDTDRKLQVKKVDRDTFRRELKKIR